MAPSLFTHPDQDVEKLDFWQLRGLYTRLVLSGASSPEKESRLADVVRHLDRLYGPDWRSGREPTLH